MRVYCEMDVDGGGWTTCATRNFNHEGDSVSLGNVELKTVWAADGTTDGAPTGWAPSATSTGWGANCAGLIKASSTLALESGKAEVIMFNHGSCSSSSCDGNTKWMWIYPFHADTFYGVMTHASAPVDCGMGAITTCKGSSSNGVKTMSDMKSGCHWYNPIFYADCDTYSGTCTNPGDPQYFIWQVSHGHNAGMIMEFGNPPAADKNHAYSFRPSCDDAPTNGPAHVSKNCGDPGVSVTGDWYSYHRRSTCSSRHDGPVMIGYRIRLPTPEPTASPSDPTASPTLSPSASPSAFSVAAPEHRWALTETSGTTAADTGSIAAADANKALHATIVGNPSFLGGDLGGMDFDGVDDDLKLGPLFKFPTSDWDGGFSFSAWTRIDEFAGHMFILSLMDVCDPCADKNVIFLKAYSCQSFGNEHNGCGASFHMTSPSQCTGVLQSTFPATSDLAIMVAQRSRWPG